MEEIVKDSAPERSLNFLEEIVENDLSSGKHKSILTRFPPEPNGYLHIGHAKSICLNFGLAQKYGGKTNLRFDDTNPTKEDVEYVDSIKEDVQWLGFQWAQELYASDYFEQLYIWAQELIKKGLAYVDNQSQEEIRLNRGTVTKPGVESPCRNRSAEENLDLFARMRAGEFEDGAMVLRAKIDMAHPNMLMRDPILYRIIHAHHHRTGDKWCIYPMYDYAHGQCDSLEQITHSICTLEFDVHRPLYDWFIEKLGIFPSKQYEFARLNLTYTVMSKRKLLELVKKGFVSGWDDPRMPTICGLRRRGYTPESIRMFADKVGVAKRDNIIDLSLLEWCVREDLNKRSGRYMVVLDPVKLVITNYPETNEEFNANINPEDPEAGTRAIPFSKELYIEREDFMEDPPKKYFRLRPGGEVRLKYSYIIKCEEVIKDSDGVITEIRCTYDPSSRPGTGEWRSVKGTIHWVSAKHANEIEVRLFDRLFTNPEMDNLEEVKSILIT
ncbi:glutamine--tRNA ligase/YqeY domain fusion protein [Bacteroidota bacterium]